MPSFRVILKNLGKTIGVLAATILFSELLRQINIDRAIILMLYLLSVLIISRITSSFVYGLLASIISTLTYDFFITDPRFSFSITLLGSPITLFSMFITTIITSTLTAQMKKQTALAQARESRAQMLYEMNQKLLLAPDTDSVVQIANNYMISHLNRSAIFYLHDPFGEDTPSFSEISVDDGSSVFHTEAEIERVHCIFTGKTLDKTEFTAKTTYLPLNTKNELLGVIGVAMPENELTPHNWTFVRMLSGQTTLALELQQLARDKHHILIENEKEKMRSNLLRAISHDLRTPLTSILGASSTVLEQNVLAKNSTCEKLIRDIRDNTHWLIRMVENLLVITRISSDEMQVKKTLEAAEEVAAEAAGIVRKRFPERCIHIHAPDELLMVPMDATLISQVIINLLENAIKNSPTNSLILLNVEHNGTYAQFTISDNGNGIPEHLLDNLFEVHPPQTQPAVDASRGMGIGLSICKTIVTAHGGTIHGNNRPNGGANFYFRIPLEESKNE